jgi:hypothetical protein
MGGSVNCHRYYTLLQTNQISGDRDRQTDTRLNVLISTIVYFPSPASTYQNRATNKQGFDHLPPLKSNNPRKLA